MQNIKMELINITNNYCVYMHKNKVNNKKYIGLTNNTKQRWRASGKGYKNYETDAPRPFYNAILKYGWDGFDSIILDDGLSFEDACELEVKYIEEHKVTKKQYGYNISKGGNGGRVYKEHPRGMLGKEQTPFQKSLLSKTMSNKELNPMTNGQVVWDETHEHPRGMLGKKHTEENKKTMMLNAVQARRKQYIVTMPDGSITKYGSQTELLNDLDISYRVCARLSKSGKPYEISKHNTRKDKKQHLVGLVIREATDNTEITKEDKDSLAS